MTGPDADELEGPERPHVHFTPAAGWLNDPNGLVHVDGTWQLCYQHHPDSLVWGPMHWGRATSRDLLHWEHQPIALRPDHLGAAFSGSAVVDTEDGGAAGNFVSRFGEMIGGSWAELFRSQRGGTYRTGVQWAEARLWLVGQAADARTADLELNIYRTVRFVAR